MLYAPVWGFDSFPVYCFFYEKKLLSTFIGIWQSQYIDTRHESGKKMGQKALFSKLISRRPTEA